MNNRIRNEQKMMFSFNVKYCYATGKQEIFILQEIVYSI